MPVMVAKWEVQIEIEITFDLLPYLNGSQLAKMKKSIPNMTLP